MSVVKSNLVKELTKNYPNFLRRDLSKLVNIILYEMQNSLKRSERVELRDIFTLDPRIQKEGIRRNPKTGEKIFVKEKKYILFKMSKNWADKVNEKE